MAGNIYGMNAKQFRQFKVAYDAMPDDDPRKRAIRENENKMLNRMTEAFNKRAEELGFQKEGNGFIKHTSICKRCGMDVTGQKNHLCAGEDYIGQYS
jgi:hypothetical protein